MEFDGMEGLIEYLSRHYQRLVEVGVGGYAKVVVALEARGLTVLATDIRPRALDCLVETDDVWNPRLDLYTGAEGIYAIRPPPELVPPLKRLARRLAIDLIIKPLAGEPCDGSLVNVAGSFFYLYPFGKRVNHNGPRELKEHQEAKQELARAPQSTNPTDSSPLENGDMGGGGQPHGASSCGSHRALRRSWLAQRA